MKSIKMSAAAALVIATAMIGPASAQNQQNPGGMMGMMGPGMMGPGMMGGHDGSGPGMMRWGAAMSSTMASHLEGRLAYSKAELKITEAQESLWNAYAAAARDNTKTMVGHCTAIMSQRGTSTVSLPERLEEHEQLLGSQLDAIRAMNKALKPLYATLSDDQKKIADQLFWGPMGMM